MRHTKKKLISESSGRERGKVIIKRNISLRRLFSTDGLASYEWGEWKRRSLDGLEVVYMWVESIYVKTDLEKQRIALLVIIGALSDG
ncbi:hypothetical protein ACFLWC_04190 [Chloroflexota bacterium]